MDPISNITPPAGSGETSAENRNTTSDAIIEYIRIQRQNAGGFLALIAIIFLACAVMLMIRASKEPSATKPADKTLAEKQADLDKPELPKTENVNIRKGDYILGAIGTLLACLVVGSVGVWLLIGLPSPSEAQQRTDARIQLLAAGGGLGMLLIVAGGVFFYQWSESFADWLDKSQEKEAMWVVLPLLMVILGAGLVLGAIQPARAEERNNTFIRRLVYGSNLGLTSLLLLVVLVVVNAVFSYRVNTKFDTTAGGFYSMSPQTEEFLQGLDQTILAYAIIPNSPARQFIDMRDVLTRFEEASRDKFKVRFVSPVTNTAELAGLKAEYPSVQEGTLGVLLTFPSDKKRSSYIPFNDFFNNEPGAAGEEPKMTFVGEGRLVKELLFLADNKQKPKVYFTQSSGELRIAGEQDPKRSIEKFKEFLEKNYLDVQPLMFDKDNPKVPEDCAILIVADPEKTMPANQVDAIRKYMTESLPGGRKGKMIVLASAAPDPTHVPRTVNPTGLEGLLKQFNVGIENKFLFALTSDRTINPYEPPVVFTPEAKNAKNPIANLLRSSSYQMLFPREVSAISGGAPTFVAKPLLETASDLGAWLDDERPASNADFTRSRAQAAAKRELPPSRPVAVIVTEGNSARLAVFGNGFMISNVFASAFAPESPPSFDLIGATIDWLRDRPPVPSGVQSKPYAMYAIPNPKTIDLTRLRSLPLWLGLLGVGGLGLGVWVTRRQQS